METVHPSTRVEAEQLDVFDVLEIISAEEYEHAEREGRRLDSLVCPDCEDPGTCAAERYCDLQGERL